MRSLYRTILRDGLVSALFIISGAISFVYAFYSVDLLKQIIEISEGFGKTYESQMLMTYCSWNNYPLQTPFADINTESLSLTKGNLIYDTYVSIDSDINSVDCELFLICNEQPVEKLAEGVYPTDQARHFYGNVAVISSDLLSKTILKDKKRIIFIDGYEYQVSGILKDIYKDGNDRRVLLFKEYMQDVHFDVISKTIDTTEIIRFVLGSNESLDSDEILNVYTWGKERAIGKNVEYKINETDNERGFDFIEDHSYVYFDMIHNAECNGKYKKSNLYILMFLFSTANAFFICKLIADRHKEEIALKRSWGEGTIGAMRSLSGYICFLALISEILGLLAMLAIKIIRNEKIILDKGAGKSILIISATYIIFWLVSNLSLFRAFKEIDPAESFKEL